MEALGTGTAPRTVALVGNPNTGKSTLFGALSGGRVRVGNYPGVTVETAVGTLRLGPVRWSLVDLPGLYSLAPRSPDERVTTDVLLGRAGDVPEPDVILCVVDAANLERNLYLVGQVLELGRPTVVALTMTDVAARHGRVVDAARLSEGLGVPVVVVRPDRRVGLDALKDALAAAADRPPPEPESPFPEPFRVEAARLGATLASAPGADRVGWPRARFLAERLLLDTDGYFEDEVVNGRAPGLREELRAVRDRLAGQGVPPATVETAARYAWASRVVHGAVSGDDPAAERETWGDRVDAVLTHRLWGTLILAAVMLVVFNAVFSWAEAPMTAIEDGVAALSGLVESHMAEGALRSLLAQGVVGGIGAVVVFLPQIAILFAFLAVLEDCGYLTRAALLMDRHMARLGLSGKSFIPLLSSFACAIPGVMAARVIENRRDRLTTIFIAPLMSCSARLPVYTLMTAAFVPNRKFLGGLVGLQGLVLLGMYVVGMLVAAGTALLLKRTVLREATPPFVMELPPYRWPSPGVVAHRVVERAGDFLRSAGTQILAVSVLMWAALYYPRLPERDAAPLRAERDRLRAEAAAAETAGDAKAAEGLNESLAHASERLDSAQMRQSLLGRAGRFIEPAVRPLGWDWRIGSAVLASFPAREVVVASLGVIFEVGQGDDEAGQQRLTDALRSATWAGTGRPLFNTPVALSVMVFFALCMQCASTLTVMRRETGGWRWPALSFAYMTGVAYLASLATYQLGMWFVSLT